MRILLVEDHAESRRGLQRLMEQRGHDVVAVGSAEEAEKAMAEQTFPFLILDWMLPGKSGLDLCRELRTQPHGDEMFILLVTARSDAEDLEQALEAGANDYLTKPFHLGLLNVRIAVAERRIRILAERNQARAALQESAKRMADILENTSDGFFALDRNWKITYVNAKAETMLGQPRQKLLGEDVRMEFPPFLGSALETSYLRVLNEQTPVEFEAFDSGSVQNWYEVKAYPSGGGVSFFFHDITERKRIEEERLTKSKLESLGTLAGGIAHDLNNILIVISGNIGLAQNEASPEATGLLSFLSKAGQAARHAARLSSRLLTFSKGGAPIKQVTSISQLLRHAIEFSLHGSNLQAATDFQSDLWKTAVDPSQVEQVVNALVLNAREAMPDGGVVTISARNIELENKPGALLPGGRYVKIAVSDKGGGIDERLATKIFDPYFTTKSSASGLGLSISYSIIKKHGGVLHLEHSSPEGSTFAFYLPVSNSRLAAPEPHESEKPVHFNRQRILVMDDEAGVRDLTSQLLGTLGCEVTTVPDGAEALRTYEYAQQQGENFQAVILDATVRGGMGGVATIQGLRKLDPGVNAIICSGYSDEAALSEFLAYGFRGALPKPFSRDELADALHRVLEAGKTF